MTTDQPTDSLIRYKARAVHAATDRWTVDGPDGSPILAITLPECQATAVAMTLNILTSCERNPDA